MAKTSGLGDNFYIGGYDLSGDVASVDQIGGGPAAGDVTAIRSSAYERIGLERDGRMSFTTYLDITQGTPPYWVDSLHTLPVADTIATYFRGTAVGSAAASLNGKQINYDPTRDNTGNLTLKVDAQANGFGLEWGEQLTAGKRTDSTATTGAFFDDGAGSNFGGQAYFQLFAFAGTSVTIDIQHATTSGGTYTSTGLTSQAFTAAPGWQRVAVANNVTINEFLKVVTTGTFSNAVFAVMFVRNASAVVF